MKLIFYRALLLISICLLAVNTRAQNNLNRNISISVTHMRLADLLNAIGKKGGFYFSYNSDMIKSDSLVTVSADGQKISALLDELFKGNVDYKESAGYIVLRPAPYRLALIPDNVAGPEQTFFISGYVVDDQTGAKIPYASVYEKQQLVSTLTNEKGFFKLKVKTDGVVTLTVSKELYRDTSVNFLSKVTVSLKNQTYTYSDGATSGKVEKTWLGRMFISSRQKIQSINLAGFVATVPVQTSLVPGLSSRGMMSGQVINKFSLNALGGYTAGVNGLEVAGVFNINKQDVKYVQAAGLFNVVGGNLRGLQAAGASNSVFGKVNGLQAAGLYNLVKDSLTGAQVAGLFNYVKKDSKGFMAAGLVNITGNEMHGFQVAGVLNKARVMKGLSVGLVNIADTLDGYAIGLVNISRNGLQQVQVYSNEITTVNFAFKTGNPKLYSILSAGVNMTDRDKFYTYGLGIGHDFIFNKRISVAAETSVSTLQSGKWKNSYTVNRISTLLNIKCSPKFGIFLGPSLNLFYDDGNSDVLSEEEQVTRNKPGLFSWGHGNRGWIGWSAGITLF